MAGSATPEPKPQLGWKATVAALVFVATILAGFGVATATNHEDNFKKKDEPVEVDESSAEEDLQADEESLDDDG